MQLYYFVFLPVIMSRKKGSLNWLFCRRNRLSHGFVFSFLNFSRLVPHAFRKLYYKNSMILCMAIQEILIIFLQFRCLYIHTNNDKLNLIYLPPKLRVVLFSGSSIVPSFNSISLIDTLYGGAQGSIFIFINCFLF